MDGWERLFREEGERFAFFPREEFGEGENELTMEHTAMCKQAEAEYRQFETNWPGFCRWCQATGMVDVSDPSVGLVDADYCKDCFAKGICPRCSHTRWTFSEVDDSSTFECVGCHWKEGTPGAPVYECSCWESEGPNALV